MVDQYKTVAHVQKYFKNRVESLNTNGGGEYVNVYVNLHTQTAADTPQHNLPPYRINLTLVELVWVMPEESGLRVKYWESAIEYVVYIINTSPIQPSSIYRLRK